MYLFPQHLPCKISANIGDTLPVGALHQADSLLALVINTLWITQVKTMGYRMMQL